MKEKFLHHIWQFKKFDLFNLHTTSGEKLEIIHSGHPNTNAGPDFSFAKILINGMEWAGNIELHIKSSDWLKHKHELNSVYDTVILHVVYEEDQKLEFLENKNILTLELKPYISESLLTHYNSIEKKPFNFIPCEQLFSKYLENPAFSLSEKLYLTKLQEKLEKISHLLNLKNNDWEAVLATVLAYTFGLKINAEAFEQLFISTDYKTIRKISNRQIQLEALFLGLTHNLNIYSDEYPELLNEEFNFIQAKYKLSKKITDLKYLRLRPANFPTIRLSQLANLISQYQNLFSYVTGAKSIEQYLKILNDVQASSYWNNHYVFDKESSFSSEKKLSKSQKELIILNAFLPVKFAYSQSIGKPMEDEIITIISELSVENNSIIENFKKLGIKFTSALDSQAFLNLYKNKCSQQQCLNCEIGFEILK